MEPGSSRYKLVKITQPEEITDSSKEMVDKLSLISKYRLNLKDYAVFRYTNREGWVCWYDPSDLQKVVEGGRVIDWDDLLDPDEDYNDE